MSEGKVKDIGTPVKDRFPTIVLYIILTEFCERLSYSGMKAFLTLYLRSKLGYTDDGATEIYHIFSCFVYVFPIMGGFVADNYLGKYRTILYMMFVYAAGNLLVAITAIPQLALPGRTCTMLGLLMITIGTGGIKPCVTSFGGDQFKMPEQEVQLAKYFSILYFMICGGALVAKSVSPILRSEVHCFGDKDCYSLAFGAPGLIILISVVIFVSARSRYVVKKPEGNVVMEFVRCLALGIKNVITGARRRDMSSHWLNTTENRFDKRFIRDIKKTLSILTLFSVLPVFWSLIDQMGSRWTLQASKMDGRIGPLLTIKPDQMQVLNPIVILILIPLAQKYFYPYLEKRNKLKNPLHRLILGGVLAGLAFIVAGVVEIYISTTYPVLPQPGYSQLRLYNGNNCSISIKNSPHNITYTIPPLSHFTKRDIKVTGFENVKLDLYGDCMKHRQAGFALEENMAISFFLDGDTVHRFIDSVDKSKSGLPIVRFLVTQSSKNISLVKGSIIEAQASTGVSSQTEVFVGPYDLRERENLIASDLEMLSGGVYTVMVGYYGNEYKSNLLVTTEANSISMALLLPQFLIMSTAEVLFAVTGNEFAFKEAPDSMKAVMTASWLLTEAAGNVLIILINRMLSSVRQETQFFFYTCLMFVSMGVFHRLCRGYQFGHAPDDPPRKERRSNSTVLYLQVTQAEDCLDHL